MNSNDPTSTGNDLAPDPASSGSTHKWTGTLDCEMSFAHELSIPVAMAQDDQYHYSGGAAAKYCREHGSSFHLEPGVRLRGGEIAEWGQDDQSAWEGSKFGDVL